MPSSYTFPFPALSDAGLLYAFHALILMGHSLAVYNSISPEGNSFKQKITKQYPEHLQQFRAEDSSFKQKTANLLKLKIEKLRKYSHVYSSCDSASEAFLFCNAFNYSRFLRDQEQVRGLSPVQFRSTEITFLQPEQLPQRQNPRFSSQVLLRSRNE